MKKIKLNLGNTTIPDKIQKARTIVTKITGNANFTTPSPALTVVTGAINKLETSYEAALDGGKTKKAIMRADETALDTLMTQLGAYVQDVSGGDELKILSSGIEVKSDSHNSTPVETPSNVRMVLKNMAGAVSLRWKAIRNAKCYLLQTSLNPTDDANWEYCDVTAKCSYTATGLESNKALWFRVAAVGVLGKSGFSDPFKASIL